MAGSQGYPPPPYNGRILFFGDSMTMINSSASLTDETLNGYSAAPTLRVRTGGRFEYIPTANNLTYTNGGASAQTLLAAIPTVLPLMDQRGDTAFVLESPNVIDTTGAAAAAAGMIAIWDAFLDERKRVIATEYVARRTDANGDLQRAANLILKEAAALRKIPFIEWESALDDDDWDWATQDGADPHPSVVGTQKLGIVAAAQLIPYLGDPLPLTFCTPYSSMHTPAIAGTTTPPTGWTVLKAATLSFGNFTYVTAADGGNPWLQTDITSTADKDYFLLYQTAATALFAGYSEACSAGELEFETLSGAGVYRVGTRLRTYGTSEEIYAGRTVSGSDDGISLPSGYGQPDLTAGRVQTPWAAINGKGEWTLAQAWTPAIYLHTDTVVRVRMRNSGMAVR
jgi:hypothetical protein